MIYLESGDIVIFDLGDHVGDVGLGDKVNGRLGGVGDGRGCKESR